MSLEPPTTETEPDTWSLLLRLKATVQEPPTGAVQFWVVEAFAGTTSMLADNSTRRTRSAAAVLN